MNSTKDLILKLKAVREEKGYSFTDILKLMEDNGDYLAKSTLSRVFADGSEEVGFNYENTIRPIANAMLDMEEIEADDNTDIKAMKAILKYKIERIEELERQLEQTELKLAEEKVKHHERIDKLHEEQAKKTEFLMNQIELKDKRIDALLNAVYTKDSQHKELLDVILSCPARKNEKCEG